MSVSVSADKKERRFGRAQRGRFALVHSTSPLELVMRVVTVADVGGSFPIVLADRRETVGAAIGCESPVEVSLLLCPAPTCIQEAPESVNEQCLAFGGPNHEERSHGLCCCWREGRARSSEDFEPITARPSRTPRHVGTAEALALGLCRLRR